MRMEQPLIGARESVFRKPRNCFEKSAAELVVKILRVQLFLRLAQIGAHFDLEFPQVGIAQRVSSRPGGSWRRHRDSRAGTNCGRNAAGSMPQFGAIRLSSHNELHRRNSWNSRRRTETA